MNSLSSHSNVFGPNLRSRGFAGALLFPAAAVALLAANASAQGDVRSRLQPITTTPKRAGVYHVATGTWTRNGNLANITGPDLIYNNSCSPIYFSAMASGDKWQHRSRVPTTAANGAPTTVNGADPLKNDEAPGCDTSYLVNGFAIQICTSRPVGMGPFLMDIEFADAYLFCGGGDMIPTQTFPVLIPPDIGTNGQSCWIIDVDLDGSSLSFTLQADQDGTYVGPSTAEQFGASWGITTPGITPSEGDGPVIAGNFTWTGGPFTGPLALCSGTDGTIWDSPVNLAEQGTGMASLDAFRSVTGASFPSGPGCYFFGGTTIHADFYLKLFCSACAVAAPGVTFCEPGVGGVIPCPCGNPPSGPGQGCNNSSATGGAGMTDTGVASLAADTVVLTTFGEKPTALSIVLGGTVNIAAGAVYGDGVRCTGGALKRLYVKIAVGGSISAPTGLDPTLSARSAALGSPIFPGQTREYQVYYRDPLVFACPLPGGATFNTSSGRTVIWNP